MQREVADRITALPGTKMYGRLSVTCQALAKTNKIFTSSSLFKRQKEVGVNKRLIGFGATTALSCYSLIGCT